MRAPYELVKYVAENGRLPVVNFAAGGVATPADAALMMQLGKCYISLVGMLASFHRLLWSLFFASEGLDGVFVGSGIFKSGNPAERARAIVQAVTHYKDAKLLAQVGTVN